MANHTMGVQLAFNLLYTGILGYSCVLNPMSVDALPAAHQPTVAIVLCTYQGATYIDEQLSSLTAQSWPVAIHIFDDSSTDQTASLAFAHCRREIDTITTHPGNLGYVANFEYGINAVLDQGFDYIALSDQDDIWHPDRVQRCMQLMLEAEASNGRGTPILIHSDLTMIDENGDAIHSSFLKYRHYTIGTSKDLAVVLGQNGVMGNTVLVNRALASLALPFPQGLHVHDYWLAVLAEVYGQRRFIEQPGVHYRIHQANASNSVAAIRSGSARQSIRLSWLQLLQRDYRLPFKEDSRVVVLETLGNGDLVRPVPGYSEMELISVFLSYLRFDRSRISILYDMFRYQFFKHGYRHRLRVALALLFTKRYKQP